MNNRKEHADKLKLGLSKLGSEFRAILCWWCKGTTYRDFEHCSVCGKNKYSEGNGLLWCNSEPAPDSVAHQVLNVAEK